MLSRALAVILVAAPALAQDCSAPAVGFRVMNLQGRAVAVWYPTASHVAEYSYRRNFSSMVGLDAPASTVCGKRVPLVVFSHGDLGCGLQSVGFTEELAKHGYIVAAPDHADAFFCHTVPPASPTLPFQQPNFLKPETWSDATLADRREDLEVVIDGLLSHPDFRDVIDAERIGAAGHSLGGYTVVGMAGGWTTWLEPRLRAVLAMSPYVMPFQVHKTLTGIRVPLMYQGGTLDVGITPFLVGPQGAYAEANSPAYFVELRKAGHLAWANCGRQHTTSACLANSANARLINEYGIAFFDRYLRDISQPLLTQKDPALAAYRYRVE